MSLLSSRTSREGADAQHRRRRHCRAIQTTTSIGVAHRYRVVDGHGEVAGRPKRISELASARPDIEDSYRWVLRRGDGT